MKRLFHIYRELPFAVFLVVSGVLELAAGFALDGKFVRDGWLETFCGPVAAVFFALAIFACVLVIIDEARRK